MSLGRGHCCGRSQDNKEEQFRLAVPQVQYYGKGSPRSECCIYDGTDERKNTELLGMLAMNMRETTEMENTARLLKLNKD
jgi:hypothetical protein